MRRYFVRLFMIFNDMVTLMLSFLIAFYVKNEIFFYIDNNRPGYFEDHYDLVIFSNILWLVTSAVVGNYNLEDRPNYEKLFDLFKANTIFFMILTSFLFAVKISHTFSRIILFTLVLSNFIILPISRIISEKLLRISGLYRRTTVILGKKKDYDYFISDLKKDFINHNDIKAEYIYNTTDELLDSLTNIKIGDEQLLILAKNISPKKLIKILRFLEGKFFLIKILPDLGEFDFANMDIREISGNLILESKYKLLSPFRIFLKRFFDLFFATIMLICFSPIFLTIILIMKITDPGPIFFGQRRVGKDRKIFKCWKFRTMVVGAEDILAKWLEENPEIREEFQKDFKLKNDPRVTKLGNFLRKTSLDELPQLWNVLNGTMSLVGPRPIVEKEVEKYGEYAETFFRVLPGITGLWQISGRNDVDYKDRIELDMYYIKNWTVWLDIYVLFGTIPAVLKRKGAY